MLVDKQFNKQWSVYEKPLNLVIIGVSPFLFILFGITVLLALFPQISLLLRDIAFR